MTEMPVLLAGKLTASVALWFSKKLTIVSLLSHQNYSSIQGISRRKRREVCTSFSSQVSLNCFRTRNAETQACKRLPEDPDKPWREKGRRGRGKGALCPSSTGPCQKSLSPAACCCYKSSDQDNPLLSPVNAVMSCTAVKPFINLLEFHGGTSSESCGKRLQCCGVMEGGMPSIAHSAQRTALGVKFKQQHEGP